MELSKQSRVKLNIHAKSDIVLDYAVKELKKYLKEIFAGLEFSDDGTSVFTIINNFDARIRFDGYDIEIKDKEITISSPYSRGILYGVYELLKMMGCNFIFPKKEYQTILEHDRYLLENERIIKNPAIEYRGFCLYNTTRETIAETLEMIDYMGKNNYNLLLTSIDRKDDSVSGNHAILGNEILGELLVPLKQRGIVIDMSEHSTEFFFPAVQHFEKHPEWFSLIDGKRVPGQICYSDMEAVNVYTESICDFIKKNDYFDIFGIWPLDGGGYCQCEKCADELTIFRANAYIASKIYEIRPDLLVEHLAYHKESFARPKDDMPGNMSSLVCHVRDNVALEWAQKAKKAGGAFHFDYLTGDNYMARANLWIDPDICQEITHVFASYGFRGIVSLYLPLTSWWQASINCYYMTRGYYDPCYDKNAATLDLIKAMFGEKNSRVMLDIFIKITRELQDKFIWSRTPHKPDYMAETIINQNTFADNVHQEKLRKAYAQIISLFDTVDISIFTPLQKKHFNYLKEYAKLQNIYYFCVDQYDFAKDTQDKAEPYFEKLGELEKNYGRVFISEEYARWRIVGRDNILKIENAQGYQPQ